MIKHYITKFEENGQEKVTAWSQINLFGKAFCWNIREVEV